MCVLERGTDWVWVNLLLIHIPLQKITCSISSVFFLSVQKVAMMHMDIVLRLLVISSILYQHHTLSFTSAD